MEPKVSIVIPVYNVEAFLPRCLDSILAQTLCEIEVICVDDGSVDRSVEILNRYAAQDARVQVVTQENRGVGSARNRGFDRARGEYVLFLDSDDWIDPAYCEALCAAAQRSGADVACASIWQVRPSRSKWKIRYTEAREISSVEERFRICRCPPDFYVMNKLLRRETLLRLGLRFPERVYYEDVVYVMRLLGECDRVVTVPGVAYHYMYNPASITKSRQTPKKQRDKYEAQRAFVTYADRIGLRLAPRYRSVTRRMYLFCGLTLLKQKECDGVRTWRLFDLIPVWRSRIC